MHSTVVSTAGERDEREGKKSEAGSERESTRGEERKTTWTMGRRALGEREAGGRGHGVAVGAEKRGRGRDRAERRERTALPRDTRSRDVAVGTHTVHAYAHRCLRGIYVSSPALSSNESSRCSSQRDARIYQHEREREHDLTARRDVTSIARWSRKRRESGCVWRGGTRETRTQVGQRKEEGERQRARERTRERERYEREREKMTESGVHRDGALANESERAHSLGPKARVEGRGAV